MEIVECRYENKITWGVENRISFNGKTTKEIIKHNMIEFDNFRKKKKKKAYLGR